MFLKYLYITIDVLLILSTFIINYIFIKNVLIEKKKTLGLSRKLLLYPTILLLFITSATLCCQIAQIYYVGGDESDHHTTNFVTNMPYGSQFAVLVLILMARLHSIFKGTAYALSRITIIIFAFWYSFGMICFVIVTIMAFVNVQIYELLLPIVSALVYLTNVSLSFVFVYKLVSVNKHIESTKHINKMLNTITKNTILCVTSIVFSTFVTVLFQIWGYKNDHVWIYIFALFDVYSNYLSIVLQFSYYNNMYIKMCGCCHNLCLKMMNKGKVRQEMDKVSVGNLSFQKSEKSGSPSPQSTALNPMSSTNPMPSTPTTPTTPTENTLYPTTHKMERVTSHSTQYDSTDVISVDSVNH